MPDSPKSELSRHPMRQNHLQNVLPRRLIPSTPPAQVPAVLSILSRVRALPAAGGSKKRMNSPSPDSDEPEKRPRKSARSESQVEDTDSSDDDTTPTFSMLEKPISMPLLIRSQALKGPNRDLDFAALKRRADIGVLAHPSVLRTFLGILGNRALLYDRSATQRPPEDPPTVTYWMWQVPTGRNIFQASCIQSSCR
ncbi:hypothetical protein PCASD_19661 [Puccinia coronata f. sp. avenae]|uniref:Uncharacterized protein n=1 Tax=Puccinia coronata f. sp. avenae TaxID=200324 RepID=A0A2N5TLI8_9BASI|nr:hypothetical protein PCASD_19661 [Puccinia coronata f. sp. avenae]